ncbi:MAG: RDD family protein [Calditrichaeota bacterium]|nr:MAG: RDD family protein [Calditrichota bacterium]MBL1205152.1 RDD family protein [Calditrichota bacterium]NOG44982.1 RDD family protein [Calditrichota bacterium]
MEEQIQKKPEYANILTRFGAILIDGLIMIPFYIPIFVIMPMLEEGVEPPMFALIVFFATILGAIVFGIWNTIVRMGKTGQSLGRKFLNIAVLSGDLQPIGVGSAALREIIGRWISGMVCYIGYLNAFWDKDNQMWHDKMASCFVYYVEENYS